MCDNQWLRRNLRIFFTALFSIHILMFVATAACCRVEKLYFVDFFCVCILIKITRRDGKIFVAYFFLLNGHHENQKFCLFEDMDNMLNADCRHLITSFSFLFIWRNSKFSFSNSFEYVGTCTMNLFNLEA